MKMQNEHKTNTHSHFAQFGFFLLMLTFAGTLLSDTGVRATEEKTLHIIAPGTANPVVLPALVLAIDPGGTIEVIRPSSAKLGSAMVMTGVVLEPSGQELEALKKNDYLKMAMLYRQRVIMGHDTPTARLGLATALWLKGDLDDSLHAFSWAKTKDPQSPYVHMGLGLVMMELGANEQARQEVSPLLDIPKMRAAALNNMGSILREGNDYSMASEQFSKALASSPDLVSAQYNLATTQMDLQNFKQAAVQYRKLTVRLPWFAESYLNEGLAHLRAKDPIMAAIALHRAKDLDPENPAIILALGLTDQTMGLDAEAASLLSSALKHHPKDQRIHQLLANSLLRSGQVGAAAKVLEQAFALAPRDVEEYFHQGLKMFLCDRPKLATEHFLTALSKGKRDSELFFALGQSLLQTDHTDAAIQALSAASRLNPDSADIHFALGLALRTGNKNKQAIREMKTASALKPSDKAIRLLLMNTLRDTKKFKDCAQVGTQLLASDADLLATRYNLALCQAMSGEFELATANLSKALKQDIDGTEIRDLRMRLNVLVQNRVNNPGAYLLWATIQEHFGNWDLSIQGYEKFILANPSRNWVVKALTKIRHLSSDEPELVVSR